MKHAIINRIVAVIALAAVIAALVFFGLWRQVESQRAEQQKQLDQTFAMQFSQLYENLFCTEQVEKVRQESLGQAAVCEAVFNATSYRDNTVRQDSCRKHHRFGWSDNSGRRSSYRSGQSESASFSSAGKIRPDTYRLQ